MMVSALPPEPDPSGWALSHGYTPYWETNGVTVFGTGGGDDPIGYFYWHAGDVDSAVQVGWDRRVSGPREVRAIIDRIITEQVRKPYPDDQ
jgi:hypothetical protein